MKLTLRLFSLAVLILPCAVSAQYYDYLGNPEPTHRRTAAANIKTNLLYDLTSTLNLGLEFRLSRKMSLDIPVNYNPWTFQDNRKWKHVLVQPSVRWWLKDVFAGHFFGVHGHWAYYNVARLPEPFSVHMQNYRFEGQLYGGGVSYGYRWNFGERIALEAEIGAGAALLDYKRYECDNCGTYLETGKKMWVGPTKIAANLIINIGGVNPGSERRNRMLNDYGFAPTTAPVLQMPETTPPYVIEKPAKRGYEPKLMASYIVPDVEQVKERTLTCTAFIDFEQGTSKVDRNLQNNEMELRKIHDMFRTVVNDPSAEITGIAVVGYASPEGNADFNRTLSERRTQAVMEHVNLDYKFPRNIITVRGAGEDWIGLDSLVSASPMVGQDEALRIIRSSDNFDRRESRLKSLAGGATYNYIYKELYPLLRRTDYRIDYTVLPFTPEEGKKVLRQRPRNLSLNELFLVANTYEPGSRDFNQVFELAVQTHPDNDVANINAAASALDRRDNATAAYYLARVKQLTPAYWNNLGVLAWLQGDKERAAQCFAEAGVQAAGNIAEIEAHFESLEE